MLPPTGLPTDTCVCGHDRQFHTGSPVGWDKHPFQLMRCFACKRPLHLHQLSGLVTSRFYCVRHCRQHRWGGHPDDAPFCLKCGLDYAQYWRKRALVAERKLAQRGR